jgi:pimeloyl-ACP methyl ester carboxylesterase
VSYSSESSYPWLNLVQYPFMTREFDCGEGWMSYVDHGQGRPVVFVHGNPTWSYLYRHLIRDIGRTNRCVAPDLLGFGLSEKPHRADFRPEAQAERFSRLMDYLKLEDVTLVVQDAGGPIGLSWAIDHPNRVRNLVPDLLSDAQGLARVHSPRDVRGSPPHQRAGAGPVYGAIPKLPRSIGTVRNGGGDHSLAPLVCGALEPSGIDRPHPDAASLGHAGPHFQRRGSEPF